MKIIHLIPYDGIGGVETAARSMADLRHQRMNFEIRHIFSPENMAAGRFATYNPLSFWRAARDVIRDRPDLLIVSLWRAALVGILAKFFHPQLRLVLFIHSNRDVHWLDYVATRLAARMATEIWADSTASLEQRLTLPQSVATRVISFVTHRLEPRQASPVRPDFIFWGRLNRQKGLDRAIELFAEIVKRHPAARFRIIGPDGGALQELRRAIVVHRLSDSVHILGPMIMEQIAEEAASASFYLQTSRMEGMAMSVVEAMQLGLVPVVTPVGEIANYCQHDHDAVIVESDAGTIEALDRLIGNKERYQELQAKAVARWRSAPLYQEDMMTACETVMLPVLSKQHWS